MNYSGFFKEKQVRRIEMIFVFTGTTSYVIDFEKFPITGTASINGKTYVLNSKDLLVVGRMGCFTNIDTPVDFGPNCTTPNCLVFIYEFATPVCICSPLFFIQQNVYDNPGKEIFLPKKPA